MKHGKLNRTAVKRYTYIKTHNEEINCEQHRRYWFELQLESIAKEERMESMVDKIILNDSEPCSKWENIYHFTHPAVEWFLLYYTLTYRLYHNEIDEMGALYQQVGNHHNDPWQQ